MPVLVPFFSIHNFQNSETSQVELNITESGSFIRGKGDGGGWGGR